MKFSSAILGLALLAFFSASAQVSVEVTLEQEQFLSGESLPVTVRVTNRSGQPLHLGAAANWLTFSVEAADGSIVGRNGDAPVVEEFDLGSSKMATKHVDIAPYFALTKQGHYHVTATVRIKDLDMEITSPSVDFDVIDGAKLWSQTFGLPTPDSATNRAPEVRRYTLEQANYLRSQLRLYARVTDETESRVFKVHALGPMLSFGQPEAQLDRLSRLHVLWQTGAAVFTHVVVNPSGDIAQREAYDYLSARPRLRADENGNISVVGGVPRVMPDEVPKIKSPKELSPASPASKS